MLLRNIEPLDEKQMRWCPGTDRSSIAGQLWHIAGVEDNWIRSRVMGQPLRFPFGVQLRAAAQSDYPHKRILLDYFHEVRDLTRTRLGAASESQLGRTVQDPDFGRITVLEVWSGVVTSFAWHAGQIALTAKLLPDSPVQTMEFRYFKEENGRK